jgi:hypothetical protein
MRTAIVFLLANFTLSFFVIGLAVALAAIARLPKPLAPGAAVERLLAWFVFFDVGVSYAYNFVMHGFFGAMSARFIGWTDSPFQFEVATASLGFAAVGFLAFFRGFDMRLAAILGPALFTFGAAAGHLYQMAVARNFAPGNSGIILYTDIGIPLVGFVLLWLNSRTGRTRPAS